MLPDPYPSPATPAPHGVVSNEAVPDEAAPFRDPRHQEAFHLLNQKLLGKETQSARKKTTTFLITLALFVGWLAWRDSDNGADTMMSLAVIVGVLFVHESGHFLAMKYFGYKDVSMFFIPFFGAAVKGRKTDVQPWQEVVMILAGPLPGILIGLPLLLLAAGGGHPWMKETAFMLILINGINLLPIKPLDGGRFFEIVLFCRWRWTSMLFGFLSWVGFGFFLLKVADLSPIVVIALTAFQASVAWRQRKMRIKLRERDISTQVPPDGSARPEQALGLFRTIEDVFAPHAVSVANLAEIARHHLTEQKQKPTGIAASLGLLAIYFGTLLLMVAGLIGYGIMRNPALGDRLLALWSRITS